MELNKEFFKMLNPNPQPDDYKYIVKLENPAAERRNTIMGSDDIEEVFNWVSDIMTEHGMSLDHKVYFPIGTRFEKGDVVLTCNFDVK